MNTKEKILESLEDKSITEVLTKKYIKAEEELLDELSKLKNWESECDCNGASIIRTIYEGEYPEINTHCIKCGGFIE